MLIAMGRRGGAAVGAGRGAGLSRGARPGSPEACWLWDVWSCTHRNHVGVHSLKTTPDLQFSEAVHRPQVNSFNA